MLDAQEKAKSAGECYLSTECVLLAILRQRDCLAVQILDVMNVPLDKLENSIPESLPIEREINTSCSLTLAPSMKRVIDLAYDEARGLNNNYIGTEHLLLGLIRESEGLASKMFASFEVRIEDAREVTRRLQTEAQSKDGDKNK